MDYLYQRYDIMNGANNLDNDRFVPEVLLQQLALVECLGGMKEFELLKRKLFAVNGKRRQRVLSIESVMISCVQFALREGWHCVYGGEVKKNYHLKYGSHTTLALAVRIDELTVVCDVGLCEAYHPWPSKVWQELRPWKFHSEADPAKLEAWVQARVKKLRQGTLWRCEPSG